MSSKQDHTRGGEIERQTAVGASFGAGHEALQQFGSEQRPNARTDNESPLAVSATEPQPNKRMKLTAPGF